MNTKTIKTNEIALHHVDGIISKDFWCESHHSHDHAEIFIHISGKMKLYIENNVYLHNGNEIRLYAPNELHFGKSDCDQQMEWYQISLASSFLQKYPLLASKILDRPKGLGNVFISRKNTTIVSLLEEIFKKQNSNLLEHYLFSNVIKILCILNEEDNNIDVQTQTPEALQNILEMLNNNLLSIKTLTDLARHTHFSVSYIQKLFKLHLNISPYKYIVMKKMSNAKELLSKGASISEACFNSGFDDYANFITSFKKHFGVTPKNHAKSTL